MYCIIIIIVFLGVVNGHVFGDTQTHTHYVTIVALYKMLCYCTIQYMLCKCTFCNTYNIVCY